MGSGIPTIEGLGKNGGGARYNYRRRVLRCSDPRTPSNLRPIPRDEGRASRDYPPPSLVLCNARSIGNKTATMCDFFVSQGIDLACVSETWVREGEVISLHEITPPGFSVLHQLRTVGRGGGVALLIREDCFFRALPPPAISGIECVGLVWGTKENLAVWLVYRPPSAPAATLSDLLEVAAGWALEFLNLLVLGDFNVHADAAPSSQALNVVTSMATLGLSQFVMGPTHQAGHTLHLIFGAGIDVSCSPLWKCHGLITTL
ncbi:uncharacterized protein LOC144326222 [Podarcis muralis]